MESTFQTYFKLGLNHIADIAAYDHMLFLLALSAVFALKNWKAVLWLVTGFTIGHSITLALAGLDIIRFPQHIIETLIPITIILTALYNIIRGPLEDDEKLSPIHYLIAIGFGLIHGMGFSNFLRAMMMPGEESSLLGQLISFNIGIEMGQILIVFVIFSINWLVLNQFKLSRRLWVNGLSYFAIGISLLLLWQMHF